jgi:hypothetical protein
MKALYLIPMWLGGLLAVLSLVAVPLCLIAVPGVENSYARGWKIVFSVVLAYPVVWVISFIVSRVVMKQMAPHTLHLWFGGIWWLLLLVAVIALISAYRIMSQP